MAATMRSSGVNISVYARQTGEIGIADPAVRPEVVKAVEFIPGFAALTELDIVGSAEIENAGSPISVDLVDGTLVDASKDVVSPADVVALVLRAHEDNTGNCTYDSSVANGFQTAFNGSGTLPPGAIHLIFLQAGYGITDATGDLLQIDAATVGDKVDVLLLGRSVALP